MRRPLVAGNWKMNGWLASIDTLMYGVLRGVGQIKNFEVAVCPPFVYLRDVGERIRGSSIALGAQNCSQHEPGAYTGEVAASMLKDFGCRYVIVGHS